MSERSDLLSNIPSHDLQDPDLVYLLKDITNNFSHTFRYVLNNEIAFEKAAVTENTDWNTDLELNSAYIVDNWKGPHAPSISDPVGVVFNIGDSPETFLQLAVSSTKIAIRLGATNWAIIDGAETPTRVMDQIKTAFNNRMGNFNVPSAENVINSVAGLNLTTVSSEASNGSAMASHNASSLGSLATAHSNLSNAVTAISSASGSTSTSASSAISQNASDISWAESNADDNYQTVTQKLNLIQNGTELTSKDDLDNVTTSGRYWWGPTSVPKNVPAIMQDNETQNNTSGYVIVRNDQPTGTKTADITQHLYDSGQNGAYFFRQFKYLSNTWKPWVSVDFPGLNNDMTQALQTLSTLQSEEVKISSAAANKVTLASLSGTVSNLASSTTAGLNKNLHDNSSINVAFNQATESAAINTYKLNMAESADNATLNQVADSTAVNSENIKSLSSSVADNTTVTSDISALNVKIGSNSSIINAKANSNSSNIAVNSKAIDTTLNQLATDNQLVSNSFDSLSNAQSDLASGANSQYNATNSIIENVNKNTRLNSDEINTTVNQLGARMALTDQNVDSLGTQVSNNSNQVQQVANDSSTKAETNAKAMDQKFNALLSAFNQVAAENGLLRSELLNK